MTSDSKQTSEHLPDVVQRTTIQQSPVEQAQSASASIEMVAIPGYEIECELGRGGVGVVYKARQVGLNRSVALKIVLAGPYTDPGTRARFLLEAESVAAMEHPGVVRVFAFGEHAGYPFLAMEYLPAGSLAAYTKQRGPLPAHEAATLLTKLAAAVAHAHSRGVVHRDIKPGNVLLTEDGQPRLTDFGLAKVDRSELSVTGQVLGTPSYMSPEQAAGKVREVGPAADVYALGAVLYDLLTGRPPFSGDSIADTLILVQYTEPKRPQKLNPSVPRDLETICLKCLEKEPEKRYLSVQDLADDLARFQSDKPIHARPTGPVERALKWGRRHRFSVSLLVAALLIQAAIVVGILLSIPPGTEPPGRPPDPPTPPIVAVRAPEYRALLIGCSDYQGVAIDLPSARKDTLRLARLLIHQYGYPEKNVVLLTGSIALPETAPTREMIEQRIRELTDAALPGDQVVIQFSGHGVGIPPKGQENFRDSFIPSPSAEEVRKWAQEGNVSNPNSMPVITAANTASMSMWEKSKNLAVLRPIPVAESHKWLKAITDKGASVWVIYAVQGSSSLGIENTPALDDDLKADIPNFVITYACKQDELSWGDNRGGLFIQSICDVLEEAESPMTYGKLIQRVRPKVKQRASEFEDPQTKNPPTQTPGIAGGNRGGLVLGGKAMVSKAR